MKFAITVTGDVQVEKSYPNDPYRYYVKVAGEDPVTGETEYWSLGTILFVGDGFRVGVDEVGVDEGNVVDTLEEARDIILTRRAGQIGTVVAIVTGDKLPKGSE